MNTKETVVDSSSGEHHQHGVKRGSLSEHARGRQFSTDPEDRAMVASDQNQLHRKLKGRHMQMIAV